MDNIELIEWYVCNLDTFKGKDHIALKKLFLDSARLEDTIVDGIAHLLKSNVDWEVIIAAFGEDWFSEGYDKYSNEEFASDPAFYLVEKDPKQH
tara:strand:- start:67 stop:348 length:282 start_codon:yes stop_codon:yes gene_type:complete